LIPSFWLNTLIAPLRVYIIHLCHIYFAAIWGPRCNI